MARPNPNTLTQEHIANHYAAAMDSVNVINALREKQNLTEDDQITIARNQKHLRLMLNKPFWTGEDLEPLRQAAT